MSLIITSSSKGTDETNQIGIARPQQYKNYMQNSLIVPPNSEIAVESIKINRLPLLDLGAGVTTNFWFGERLGSNASFADSLSYMIPSENSIGKSISPLDFSEEYAKILKSAYSFHPEIDSVNIKVNVSSGTSGFAGFDFEIPQVSASAVSLVPPATTGLMCMSRACQDELDHVDPTWDGSSCSGLAGDFAQLQPRATEGGPISLYNGLLTYSNVSNLANFTVGLSRPYCYENGGSSGYVLDEEDVFNSNGEGIGQYGDDFYDYAAQVDLDGKLRLYHAIPPPKYDTEWAGAGDTSKLMMSEIRYYTKTSTSMSQANGSNTTFNTGSPIDWSGSGGAISFEVEGEKVTISVSGNIVASPVKVNASTKGQVPKPVGQTAWKMYPTVSFWEDGDNITISAYNCRTSSTIWNNQPENSWITRTLTGINLNDSGVSESSPLFLGSIIAPGTNLPAWNNALTWPTSVDTRQVYRPFEGEDVGGTIIPLSGAIIRTYRGVSGSLIGDYENIFIMGKSERYMSREIQQWQPNSQLALGFQSFAINPNSGMSSSGTFGAYFSSAQRPSLSSLHSAFIRVPTFTHETYNFGTGNPSKILFQIPRFDNSGVDTGALYYQNNDKTYVDLHNSSPLRITDLDIHVVRKNETFVEDLTGSTEIVFHIRKIK